MSCESVNRDLIRAGSANKLRLVQKHHTILMVLRLPHTTKSQIWSQLHFTLGVVKKIFIWWFLALKFNKSNIFYHSIMVIPIYIYFHPFHVISKYGAFTRFSSMMIKPGTREYDLVYESANTDAYSVRPHEYHTCISGRNISEIWIWSDPSLITGRWSIYRNMGQGIICTFNLSESSLIKSQVALQGHI